MTKQGPLHGIRICDLSRILAGPFATMKLGDMGADVVKVEHPVNGDDTRLWGPPFYHSQSPYHLSINRSKRSLTLNLKKGKAVLERLIRQSDVLIENFRPGTFARIGFSWEELQELNPRLIYCTISGYGQLNTEQTQAAYDLVIQGESGVMDITGSADRAPSRVGVSLADLQAGQNAVEGILLALLNRTRTGRGDRVDIALYDSILALHTYHAQGTLLTDHEPGRMESSHPSLVPYQSFLAKDAYFVVGVGNNTLWQKFCKALNRTDWLEDERFNTNEKRVKNRAELVSQLAQIFQSKPRNDWVTVFREAGVPSGPVRSVREAVDAAEQANRDMVIEVAHSELGPLKMLGNPVKLSSFNPKSLKAPPTHGQHSDAILTELGFSQAEIEGFREAGII